MNLLDRYIFRSVLFSCALSVALLAFVLMLGNTIRDLLGYALAGQLPMRTFAQLVWLLIPAAATYALPIGTLAGVLLTLGRLSADSEIVAMRTAGISLARLARPVILLGILGAAGALYVNFSSMPRARVIYHELLDEAVRSDPLHLITPGTPIHDFPGFVILVDSKKGNIMYGLRIWELDKQGRQVRSMQAAEGRFDYDRATNELVVTLSQARAEYRDQDFPEDFSKPSYNLVSELEPARLSLAGIFQHEDFKQKLKWMTLPELAVAARNAESDPKTSSDPKARAEALMQIRLTVQDKFTTGLAVLSFALVGVPLGIKVSRRETSANLGVALILALSYYLLTVLVWWLDKHPELRPDLLLWIPNLLFAGLGLWLFTRIDKR